MYLKVILLKDRHDQIESIYILKVITNYNNLDQTIINIMKKRKKSI